MTTYRFAVKVRKTGRYVWRADCPACEQLEVIIDRKALRRVYRWAVDHAATCPDLHWANWANWAAACRSCRSFGKPAKACMTCLTRRPL